MRRVILRPIMDKALESRAIIVGHLSLTLPAIAAILLVPFLGLRIFGPSLFVYYVLAGMALAWQWYCVALPGWTSRLARKGVQAEDGESLAHRAGLAWPRESMVGPFAFHTTAAVLCGLHLGPWSLRWLMWGLSLAGMSRSIPAGDDYLQHFELASIVPAFVLGYVLSRHLRRLAMYAWILPTVVLAYKLLTFSEPPSSIFAPHHTTRFSYFFVIQRSMPWFTSGFLAGDPVRIAQQVLVIAPFYSGLAYSLGALAARHDTLRKFFGHSPSMKPESEIS